MKFLALLGLAAASTSDTVASGNKYARRNLPSTPISGAKYASDLHEEMESFVKLVEAIDTHNKDTVYDAIAKRKNEL